MLKCKKICIVTVYNSYNYGSILQAKILSEILSKYGEVCFLKTGARNGKMTGIKILLKALLHLQIKRVFFEFKNLLYFHNVTCKFKVISLKSATKKCMDFCFGSDEIWNISRDDFASYPIFWGYGLLNKHKVSYGASINNTEEKQLDGTMFIECLKQFDAVSVRDSYSQKILKKLTEKDIQTVLDPSMLVDYRKDISPTEETGYIAAYIFESKFINSNLGVKILKNIAFKYKKELISTGVWRAWADRNLTSVSQSPFDYYINADYVLTNTFHGTVFAILYRKQFVSFVDKNIKIKELLKYFQLEDRMVNEYMTVEQICGILDSKISYDLIENILIKSRMESLNFIKNNFDLNRKYEQESGSK